MDTPKTQTKPELGKLKDPDSIGLDIVESSSIDIGISTFNEKKAIVVYIRPKYIETTRWLKNASGLETRTMDIEALELKNKILEGLRDDETYLFNFETPTPTWGYIFDINIKARMYDLVRGLNT
jgi:hypothetical protein